MLRKLYISLVSLCHCFLNTSCMVLGIKPKVTDKYKTVEHIVKTRCSVSRYGDGEFLLMKGWYIGFQKFDEKLAGRLRSILKSDLDNHIVCLPDVFNTTSQFTDKASSFWKKHVRNTIFDWCRLVDLNKQYYDTQMTRFYLDEKDKTNCTEYLEKLKMIWSDREVVIVEGHASRMGVRNDLFDNAKSIKRVLCPAENAFSEYDRILEAVVNFVTKDKLVLIALGPTATVLAYDLSKLGYQAIDLGHLDVEYEWYKRGTSEKCAIEGKYVNEVGSRDISDCTDPVFKSQVLTEVL